MDKWLKGLSISIFILFFSVSNCFGFKAHVVKVYDGDTITVLDLSQQLKKKVRLYGIDSPEIKPLQEYGTEARAVTFNLLNDKDIEVIPIMIDRYGRIVGVVMVQIESNTISINEELLKTGSAWLERNYWKKKKYPTWDSLETKAKTNKIGLWANPNAIKPSIFRHNK